MLAMKVMGTEEDKPWWERLCLVCGVNCNPQQGNNTPTPWQKSDHLGSVTHRATVRSLLWDLFCFCCINSFLSYRFPACFKPTLTACSLRGTIIRENYALFTQWLKVSDHWFCLPYPCIIDGISDSQIRKELEHENAVCASKKKKACYSYYTWCSGHIWMENSKIKISLSYIMAFTKINK